MAQGEVAQINSLGYTRDSIWADVGYDEEAARGVHIELSECVSRSCRVLGGGSLGLHHVGDDHSVNLVGGVAVCTKLSRSTLSGDTTQRVPYRLGVILIYQKTNENIGLAETLRDRIGGEHFPNGNWGGMSFP